MTTKPMNIMNINVSSFYYSVSNMLFYIQINYLLTCNYQQIKYLVFFTRKYFFFYGVPLWYIIKDFLGSDVIERVWVCMNEMADISCAFIFDLISYFLINHFVVAYVTQ